MTSHGAGEDEGDTEGDRVGVGTLDGVRESDGERVREGVALGQLLELLEALDDLGVRLGVLLASAAQ